MFTAFNSETSRPQTVDVDSVASMRLPSTWNNHNNNNNKKGIRTEPEVECIEARTRMKAGAPVCSGSLLCSLSNEPRIGLSRCVCVCVWVCVCVCVWVGVRERERGKYKHVCLLPLCFQSLLPILRFSVQTSDEPLIPLGLSHSLPLSLSLIPMSYFSAAAEQSHASSDSRVTSAGERGSGSRPRRDTRPARRRERPLCLLHWNETLPLWFLWDLKMVSSGLVLYIYQQPPRY